MHKTWGILKEKALTMRRERKKKEELNKEK